MADLQIDVPAVFEAFLLHELEELREYRAAAAMVMGFLDFLELLGAVTTVMNRRRPSSGGRASTPTAGPRWRSGEKVPVSGVWRTLEGREAALKHGDRFPPSQSSWGLVQSTEKDRRPPRTNM